MKLSLRIHTLYFISCLLWILTFSLSSCHKSTESIYANENYYFDLDTIRAANLKINEIKLDNSKEQLSLIGKVNEVGYGDVICRIPYGDSFRLLKGDKRIVNEFGKSDTALYMVQTKTFYIGQFNELKFEERKEGYTLYYCSFLSTDLKVESNFGMLSRKTKLKEIIKKFPNSARWLNNYVLEPGQILFEISDAENQSLYRQDLNWIPFSDGEGGTVHLVFFKQKLIYLKRNWSDI